MPQGHFWRRVPAEAVEAWSPLRLTASELEVPLQLRQ